MVPLIGRLEIFDKLLAYVLRFLSRIVTVRKAFPFHKILSRFALFLLGKLYFKFLNSSLGINCNRLISYSLVNSKSLTSSFRHSKNEEPY